MRALAMAVAIVALAGCGQKKESATSHAGDADPHAGAGYSGSVEGVDHATAICGEVRIAPELASQVTAKSILFVFSKAQLGGGAPAAVVRRETPAFPAKFCLSQKNSMAGASFAGAQYVTARVEFDTSAGGQAGDLETVTKEPVTVGTNDLVLTIDTVRP